MYTRNLAEALRHTLISVERNTELSPDDPTVVELKRILLSRIASVEGQTDQELGEADASNSN